MADKIEWLTARKVVPQCFSPTEDWVGASTQDADKSVLTFGDGGGAIIAIEGTPRDLARVAGRIQGAVTQLLLAEIDDPQGGER